MDELDILNIEDLAGPVGVEIETHEGFVARMGVGSMVDVNDEED